MATGQASPSTPCFINDQCAYQLVANIDNNHLPNSEVWTTFYPLVNVYCFFEHNHKLVIQSALISVWFIQYYNHFLCFRNLATSSKFA